MLEDSNARSRVRCACGATIAFPRAAAGRKARCPKCSKQIRLPDGDSIDVPQSAAVEDATLEQLAAAEKGGSAVPVCPNCRAIIEAGAMLCVACGCDLTTGRLYKTRHVKEADALWWRTNLRGIPGEVALFAFGVGVLLLIVGFGVAPTHKPNAPPIMFGLPRTGTLIFLIFAVSAMNLAAGLGLWMYRKVAMIQACRVSACMVALGWLGFMIAATGMPGFDLISLTTIVIAVVANTRASMAIADLRRERADVETAQ